MILCGARTGDQRTEMALRHLRTSATPAAFEQRRESRDGICASRRRHGRPVAQISDAIPVDEARAAILGGSAPSGMCVQGDLDLLNTPATHLPNDLTVGGDLDLCGTQITELPAGLTVTEDLFLSEIPISSLPSQLTVGGDLYMVGLEIDRLPDDLSVGGNILMYGTTVRETPANFDLALSTSG